MASYIARRKFLATLLGSAAAWPFPKPKVGGSSPLGTANKINTLCVTFNWVRSQQTIRAHVGVHKPPRQAGQHVIRL